MAVERLGRAAAGRRTGRDRPEEFPARPARALPGGVGGRRAGPDRRFRGDRRDARIGRPAPLAAGLLRSGRVQRPALGSGRGRRSGRQRAPAVPVARGPVADGPGAHAAAGSGEAGAVARPPAGARRDAASRTRLKADTLAGAAAGADLAVAFPVGAATTTMALGRRGLVAPLRLVAGPVRLAAGPVTLVAGPALSPATRVVMKDIDTTTARKPETGAKPRWLCWSEIISDAAVKEETWRASSC